MKLGSLVFEGGRDCANCRRARRGLLAAGVLLAGALLVGRLAL